MLAANVFYVRPKTDLEDGNHTWHHDRKYMVREVKNELYLYSEEGRGLVPEQDINKFYEFFERIDN